MEAVTLKITFSGRTFEFRKSIHATWDEVVVELSAKVGVPADGLRLIHKGHTVERRRTLAASQVKDGCRLLALKTSKQHDSELRTRTQANTARATTVADSMRDRAIAGATVTEAAGTEKSSMDGYLGDADACADALFVLVCQGSKTYAVLVADEALTVRYLKSRLEGMTGVAAKDLRLLFGGKSDIDDDEKLVGDLHVKRGSKFVLMFKRAQHEKLDSREELTSLRAQTEALEDLVTRTERKVQARLISDYAELSLLIGELGGECSRLAGNVKVVHIGRDEAKDAEAVTSLSETLQVIEGRVSALQEIALSMLQR
jgi:hypothetical protein